ncbi:MAG: glutamate racemase [Ignavibacteria bacterium]|jgi:glutamate racemase|nr:glutamate racemase [Ignavibacteria bacterium]MDH7527058.1 glutamate racemase [Ignavibacteria bacterium]
MKISPQNPIGVFDSGIGGLTVVKELMQILPNESIVYFGDTARVPYGTKSEKTIKEYSIQNTKFLLSKNVKIIVIACNTASAVALSEIQSMTELPVVGVIKPGAEAAVKNTKNKRVAVIGTTATIQSKAYEKEIKLIDPSIEVYGKACPLFVPIVEEGWSNHKIAQLAAEEYLSELKKKSIDTMVLGCTHYPLLKDTIQKVIGEDVILVDSGVETARVVKQILEKENLINQSTLKPNYSFFVSDLPQKFREVGEMFLGRQIENLVKVDLSLFLKPSF